MHQLLLFDLPTTSPAFAQLFAQPALPETAALCRQAEVLEQEPPREDAQAAWLTPAERWLLHALRLSGSDAEQAPWARLAVLADGVAGSLPPNQPIGLLTPAHLRLGRDSLTLADPAELSLSAAEAQELFDAVAPLFAEAGWTLRLVSPLRWYAAHPSLAEVVTAGVARAQGRSVAAWMPGGPAARPWRQLLTQVQMTWQYHPVNEARAQRGQPDVNTLWIHGCGALPPGWCSPLRPIDADDAVSDPMLAAALQGLAQAEAPATLQLFDARRFLRDDPAQGAQQLDAALSAAIARAVQQHGAVQLTLAGEIGWRTVLIRRPKDWMFWRRSALATLFAGI
jgi:hypothetical protein